MRSLFKILIPVAILLTACGSGDPEQGVVDTFFTAVQNGDQAGMARVSLTTFDGDVASWEIVERGTESEGPFQLSDLEAQLAAKRAEVSAQRAGNASFLSDNNETYEAYKNKYAEDPSAGFQGALADFHEELQARQVRVNELQAEADQLAFDVEALKNAATLSLSTPVDTNFEGQVVVKPLQVRVNDGSQDTMHTVVLQRYQLADSRQDRTPTARWIIAEVQPAS